MMIPFYFRVKDLVSDIVEYASLRTVTGVTLTRRPGTVTGGPSHESLKFKTVTSAAVTVTVALPGRQTVPQACPTARASSGHGATA